MNCTIKSLRSCCAGLLLLALTACANGPIDPEVDPNLAYNTDIIPSSEPISVYGNPSYYHVRGKTYEVLDNAEHFDKVGIASWYGKDFDGKLTANREVYHMNGLSAASRTLPLPSYVKVTNLKNHKSIVVRVNDRGPYKTGRLIDLSYGAAKKLGFASQGITKVRVTAVSTPSLAHGHHFLQMASFSKPYNADHFKDKLLQITDNDVRIRQYFDAHHHKLYRVEVGPFESRVKLHEAQREFKREGFAHSIAVLG